MFKPRLEYEDMSPRQRMHRSRVYLALIVAFSHLVLMILGITDRLAFTVPTRYELLKITLENPMWFILHGACFLAIVITLKVNSGVIQALASATGVMGSWAFLSFLWGLTTPTPVSLAGPVLGGAIATLSYLLTIAWARSPQVHERTD